MITAREAYRDTLKRVSRTRGWFLTDAGKIRRRGGLFWHRLECPISAGVGSFYTATEIALNKGYPEGAMCNIMASSDNDRFLSEPMGAYFGKGSLMIEVVGFQRRLRRDLLRAAKIA